MERRHDWNERDHDGMPFTLVSREEFEKLLDRKITQMRQKNVDQILHQGLNLINFNSLRAVFNKLFVLFERQPKQDITSITITSRFLFTEGSNLPYSIY